VQVAEAKAPACQLPAETGAPLSRWSCPELAAELTARGITDSVSASRVRRWLREDAIKPWQYRSWIFIRDPDFRAKAKRVLDLYARTFEGIPLSEGEYVVSSDEKTSIQARYRCHPTLAPGRARALRVNHEYGRGGALAYLAAYDVHRATVFGHCESTTGIVPFAALVEQVMSAETYASAKRVSGSSTTVRPTGASGLSTVWPAHFPTPSWSTPPSTPPGPTTSRSSSRSSSARSSNPTTSQTSPRFGTGSEHSKTATTSPTRAPTSAVGPGRTRSSCASPRPTPPGRTRSRRTSDR
jgi:hypothetical protein